jgi:hypothetical protein
MAALPGCVASAEGGFVADYPTVYVESVPPRIEYYPRTYYRGSPAYLVDGRWYYRTHDRWAVFREEPVELREYRVRREPRYLAPQTRSYGRSQERLIAERRAEDNRRRERAEAQRAEEHRRAEQRQRAEEHQRFEQQRDAQHRAEQDRRLAERRGRATRKHDRSTGDQHDSRDERDRRHNRQD